VQSSVMLSLLIQKNTLYKLQSFKKAGGGEVRCSATRASPRRPLTLS